MSLPHGVVETPFLLNRKEASRHALWTKRSYFFFFFSFCCQIWLVPTVKYCCTLQMYFRYALQPSRIWLMMFFTLAGDPVTRLGWFRKRRVKLFSCNVPFSFLRPNPNPSCFCLWIEMCLFNKWLLLRRITSQPLNGHTSPKSLLYAETLIVWKTAN